MNWYRIVNNDVLDLVELGPTDMLAMPPISQTGSQYVIPEITVTNLMLSTGATEAEVLNSLGLVDKRGQE